MLRVSSTVGFTWPCGLCLLFFILSIFSAVPTAQAKVKIHLLQDPLRLDEFNNPSRTTLFIAYRTMYVACTGFDLTVVELNRTLTLSLTITFFALQPFLAGPAVGHGHLSTRICLREGRLSHPRHRSVDDSWRRNSRGFSRSGSVGV